MLSSYELMPLQPCNEPPRLVVSVPRRWILLVDLIVEHKYRHWVFLTNERPLGSPLLVLGLLTNIARPLSLTPYVLDSVFQSEAPQGFREGLARLLIPTHQSVVILNCVTPHRSNGFPLKGTIYGRRAISRGGHYQVRRVTET